MKDDLNAKLKAQLALDAALATIPAAEPEPEDDYLLIKLKQIREYARAAVNAASHAVYSAQQAKIAAERAFTNALVDVEIRETDLGIRDDHGLIDEGDEDL